MTLARFLRLAVYAAGASVVILTFVTLTAWQWGRSDGPRSPVAGSGEARFRPSIKPSVPAVVSHSDSTVTSTGNGAQFGRARLMSSVAAEAGPSVITVEPDENGVFRYLVNEDPQVFIGMGYNPIYRHLSDDERAANYERDFQILSQAGVNHLIGWDFDKGYEQDKFDEVTLDQAFEHGIGVVMPFYLPPDGNYRDEEFVQSLMDEAAQKIARFKDHPALRMWGVGNEVLLDNRSPRIWAEFAPVLLRLADLFHTLDPDHPVIYREAEGYLLPAITILRQSGLDERPWLLFGVNVYSLDLEQFLEAWPYYGFERSLLVSEFGAEPQWSGGRELGYLNMWRTIRAYPDYVLGGAAYAWTTEGPEPTDKKWGLMDAESRPVDETFEQLASEWRNGNGGFSRYR